MICCLDVFLVEIVHCNLVISVHFILIFILVDFTIYYLDL